MFNKLTEDLLELTVVERGLGAGNALPAFIPLCCSIVLCLNRGCSSSSSEKED